MKKPIKYKSNSVIKYFMYREKLIFEKSNFRIMSALIAGTATNPTNFKIMFASVTLNKFFFPKKKPKKHIKDTGITPFISKLKKSNKLSKIYGLIIL